MTVFKHPSKPGNPTNFSIEDHKRIVAAYKDTIVLTNVAGRCRRPGNTIKNWLNRGKNEHEMGLDTEFARFYVDVKETLAESIISIEKKLMKCEKGWQRYAWMLERCARKDYSQYGDVIEKIEEMLDRLKAKNQDSSRFDQDKMDILAQVKKLQARDGQAIAKQDNPTD